MLREKSLLPLPPFKTEAWLFRFLQHLWQLLLLLWACPLAHALITTVSHVLAKLAAIGPVLAAPTFHALSMVLVLLPLLNAEGVKATANAEVRLADVRMVSVWEWKVTRRVIITKIVLGV